MKIQEINNPYIWDEFIIRQNFWSLFQTYGWGLVQEKLSNQVIRLGLFDQQQLVGIAQVILINAKRGKFLHIRQGPIFIPASISKQKQYWQTLIIHLKQLAQQNDCWFIRVSPMISDSPANKKLLVDLGFRLAPIQAMDAQNCWVLDLKPETEILLSQMRKTTRNLIRQATKLGVEVEITSDINRFLKLYTLTYQRHKFVPHLGIKEEFEIFNRANQALLLVTKYQHQDLAAALILFFGPQAIYHHGASIKSKIPITYLLQWQAIQEAKKRGCQYYNFWGIAPHDKPNHPWKGITLFKTGFGGEEKQFLHAHDLVLSNNYWITYGIETARKLWRGY